MIKYPHVDHRARAHGDKNLADEREDRRVREKERHGLGGNKEGVRRDRR